MTSLLLIIFCAVVALVVIGGASFLVLLKLGVIVHEAQRPAFQDHGSYSLEQGREVRSEEEQPQGSRKR